MTVDRGDIDPAGHDQEGSHDEPGIAAALTGEEMMTKHTGGRDRPPEDEIARLAYQFYETRGRADGNDVDDWLSAERELTPHHR